MTEPHKLSRLALISYMADMCEQLTLLAEQEDLKDAARYLRMAYGEIGARRLVVKQGAQAR